MTRRLPIIRIGYVGEHFGEDGEMVPDHYRAELSDPGPHKMRDFTNDLYPSATGESPDEAADKLITQLQIPSAQVVNSHGKGLKKLSNKAAMETVKAELADFDPFSQEPEMIASDIANLQQGDEQADEVIDLYTTRNGGYYTSKVSGDKRNGKDPIRELLMEELPELMSQLREEKVNSSKVLEEPEPTGKSKGKGKRSRSESGTSPSDPNARTVAHLSEEFGLPGTKVRRALRKMYSEDPELSHEHRSRWVWDTSNPSELTEWEKVRSLMGR